MAQDRAKRARKVAGRERLPGGGWYGYDGMSKLVQSMFDGHCSVKTCGHDHAAPFFAWSASALVDGELEVPACRVCRFAWEPEPVADAGEALEVARSHVEVEHPEVYARYLAESR